MRTITIPHFLQTASFTRSQNHGYHCEGKNRKCRLSREGRPEEEKRRGLPGAGVPAVLEGFRAGRGEIAIPAIRLHLQVP